MKVILFCRRNQPKVFTFCYAEVYFLFVMGLCAISVAESVVVANIHNRSSGVEASLPMRPWVSDCDGFSTQKRTSEQECL